MYRTKYTEQNILYQLLDFSVRVGVRVRARVRVRAEWATEELPKHPMAAYSEYNLSIF